MRTISSLKDVQLMDAQPAASRVTGTGIRDLLRDTALLVSMLTQGGNTESVKDLRQQCAERVAAFAEALEQRGFAADVREDAQYAQCGLLDETVLRCQSIVSGSFPAPSAVK
jgi:type VI secretion system protein ImpK